MPTKLYITADKDGSRFVLPLDTTCFEIVKASPSAEEQRSKLIAIYQGTQYDLGLISASEHEEVAIQEKLRSIMLKLVFQSP